MSTKKTRKSHALYVGFRKSKGKYSLGGVMTRATNQDWNWCTAGWSPELIMATTVEATTT